MKTQKLTVSAEDKAINAFAEVLIKQLETVDAGDWTAPWISANDSQGGMMCWPKNLDGREYANMNAFLLMMVTNLNKWNAPIFATFERFKKLNFKEDGKFDRVTDSNGDPLPMVMVNKGEKSTLVTKTLYTAVHKETRQKLDYSDYLKLSDEEQKDYNVFPRNFVYHVFNIDQTNLKEARPELYAKLVKKTEKTNVVVEQDGDVSVPAVDMMIARNLWQCKLEVIQSAQAYYSPSQDKVVIPEKKQFRRVESFYGTLFHECAHSTGAQFRYDRQLGSRMDTKAYAREELVAELTAALVASRYGLMKHIKCDSLPYLKNWLEHLKAEAGIIKDLLNDVKKASSQIIRRLDVIQKRMDELEKQGLDPFEVEDFMEMNPITGQPMCDPARYLAKEEVVKEAMEEVKI